MKGIIKFPCLVDKDFVSVILFHCLLQYWYCIEETLLKSVYIGDVLSIVFSYKVIRKSFLIKLLQYFEIMLSVEESALQDCCQRKNLTEKLHSSLEWLSLHASLEDFSNMNGNTKLSIWCSHYISCRLQWRKTPSGTISKLSILFVSFKDSHLNFFNVLRNLKKWWKWKG